MLRSSSSGAVQQPVPLAITSVWYLQGSDSSGTTQASVIVPAHDAALLSSYAAQQDVALVATDVPKDRAPAVTPTSAAPSTQPSTHPSSHPTTHPSTHPHSTAHPSARPSSHPSSQPTRRTTTKSGKDGK
jgi:hypothetical protein